MKYLIPSLLITLTGLNLAFAQETKAPETLEESISYTIGSQVGGDLKEVGISIVPEQFLAGVLDAIEGKGLKISAEDMSEAMIALQKQIQDKQQAASAEKIAENEKFFEENGKKEGIVTTKSGLQYEVLEKGEGEKPGPQDVITAHYHGTLLDGTVFDSSVDRGEPAQFPVGGVIPGWIEALQLMPVGSKWRLYLPSDLAYGARGAGEVIGPNAALIFDVELISIDDTSQ